MHLEQLFSMGGYALYVWPAYFITFIIFLSNIFFAQYEKKKIKKIIQQFILYTDQANE